MSLYFYDQFGKSYAYSDDGQTIYTFGGAPIAYLDGDSIYGFDGRHVGYFLKGAILDPGGNTLLFTDAATGGPMKPMKQMKPMKGMKQMLPMKGMKQMKPIQPMFSLDWSQLVPKAVF
jgi:hypothetical protein